MRRFPELMFDEGVREAQQHNGVRDQMARFAEQPHEDRVLSERERGFIEARDSFYIASVGEDGWPYVQFRGGPRGFLRVLDERTLGFADFRGNRQYITTGHVSRDDRVALILMDYIHRARIKILARARVVDVEDDPDLIRRLTVPDYKAVVERAIVLDVEAFDWNCPQHITPRYTASEMREHLPGLREILERK